MFIYFICFTYWARVKIPVLLFMFLAGLFFYHFFFPASYLDQHSIAHLLFWTFMVMNLALISARYRYLTSLVGSLSGKVLILLFFVSSSYFSTNLASETSIIFFNFSSFKVEVVSYFLFIWIFLRMLFMSAQDWILGGID